MKERKCCIDGCYCPGGWYGILCNKHYWLVPNLLKRELWYKWNRGDAARLWVARLDAIDAVRERLKKEGNHGHMSNSKL